MLHEKSADAPELEYIFHTKKNKIADSCFQLQSWQAGLSYRDEIIQRLCLYLCISVSHRVAQE